MLCYTTLQQPAPAEAVFCWNIQQHTKCSVWLGTLFSSWILNNELKIISSLEDISMFNRRGGDVMLVTTYLLLFFNKQKL